MSISVAMATYNGAKFLQSQLISIKEQKRAPDEIVITDDGSTDATIPIVEEFARNAPFPVRLYKNELRKGFKANFMYAASLCRSDLIAFCDQDDLWYPDKIANLIKVFSNPEVLLAYHNAHILDHNSKVVGVLDNNCRGLSINPELTLSPTFLIRGFTQVFRRSLLAFSDLSSMSKSFEECNSDEKMAHDRWFSFFASILGTIAYVRVPLAGYRQHGANLYGANQKEPSQINRISTIDHAAWYLHHAQAIEARVGILYSAQDRLQDLWLDRIKIAIPLYARLAHFYENRSVIYKDTHLINRLTIFLHLFQENAYRRPWGLGSKALLKDFFFGVLFSTFARQNLRLG